MFSFEVIGKQLKLVINGVIACNFFSGELRLIEQASSIAYCVHRKRIVDINAYVFPSGSGRVVLTGNIRLCKGKNQEGKSQQTARQNQPVLQFALRSGL